MISEHASPLAGPGSVDSGGQNVYVAQVARHLSQAGYWVDVFTRRDRPDLPEVLEWENGVRIVHVPAGPARFVRKEELLQYMPAFTDFMVDFFQHQTLPARGAAAAQFVEPPYDLIHANFWMSGLVAADLKRRLGLPFVITFHALGRVRRIHQGRADGFPSERFEIEDRIVAEADAILAECPQDEEDLIHLYNASPEQITIIPCGFDPAELWPVDRAAARQMLRLPGREFLILQLGRMVPRKGVDTVVEALALLQREQGIQASLVIAGGETEKPDPASTPEIARLQTLAAELGVAERVHFVGRSNRQTLKNYYSASDVFVSTPWYEPFGITPVEAMACGVPVIGSNVGGIRYTVRHAETGFLVPPRDAETLARRLAQLARNPELRTCMGQQAIQRANELFTWQKVANKVAELYERVLVQVSPAYQPENDPLNLIMKGFDQAVQALQQSSGALATPLLQAAEAMAACLERGGKIMVCGNGGSAADSQHFAAELLGRYKISARRSLPVIALTADTVFLTAWANDAGYDQVFARQVEALGQTGDLLLGISTSGRSRNVIEAFKAARQLGLGCIALLGRDGGDLLPLAHLALVVPATETPRIQEVQILLLHLLAELIESRFLNEALGVESALGENRAVTEIEPQPASEASFAGPMAASLWGMNARTLTAPLPLMAPPASLNVTDHRPAQAVKEPAPARGEGMESSNRPRRKNALQAAAPKRNTVRPAAAKTPVEAQKPKSKAPGAQS